MSRRRMTAAAFRVASLAFVAGLVLSPAACDEGREAAEDDLSFPGEDAAGKTDIFGRELVGVAAPYTPDPRLADADAAAELDDNVRARREQAWKTIHQVLQPVPLLGVAERAEDEPMVGDVLPDGIPEVPRFQTWYGLDDTRRMFQELYGGLTPAQRLAKEAFDEETLEDIEAWNASALERSKFWPLERYLKELKALGNCPEGTSPEACAIAQQSKFSGAAGGIARIAYSPGTTMHILGNYAPILKCLESLDGLSRDALPAADDNFTHCFDEEFPSDAVLIKAQWSRIGFGTEDIPVFDTDAQALAQRLASSATADWGTAGNRRANPGPDDIYTIRLRSGATFRLTALHVMTKELRHWQWITMWWSDKPEDDFGADRPAALFEDLHPVWSNYKMCAVSAYVEGDDDPAARYPEHPTLAQALAGTAKAGDPSWCSNPYIEHGRGNARTNCIGCHQHGGATVDLDWDQDGKLDKLDLEEVIDNETEFPSNGRLEVRKVFPADYLWSFARIDDFAHLIKAEVQHLDHGDEIAAGARIDEILAIADDPARGQATFAQRCAPCHGVTGNGSGFAPSLFNRVPTLTDRAMLLSILRGKNEMPAWESVLDNQKLADLHAFLRETFGQAPE